MLTDDHLPCMQVLTYSAFGSCGAGSSSEATASRLQCPRKGGAGILEGSSQASAAAAKGWGVSVSRPGRIGGDSSSIWLACTAEELSTLERCVAEAAAAVEEAGDFAMLMVQECDLGDDCMLIAF